jgi:SAM-dependent methyltransferase
MPVSQGGEPAMCDFPEPPGRSDWNAVWMAAKERRLTTPGFLPVDDFFGRAKNVERYERLVAAAYHGHVKRQLASMAVPDGATVLDIGAGPGTLAVPLARRGCRVTAVEPSAPMRRALRESTAREGVAVTILEEPWERIDPAVLAAPFDVVIASYSLMMVDLRAALAKMHAVCSGSVFLFWSLTPPGERAIERALWPVIHHAAYPPEPMADCVYNVLFQMGIMATLEAEYTGFEHRFRDLDEAVAEFRDRLNCPPEKEELLRESLGRLLPRDADGAYRVDRSSWNAAIRWDVRHQPITDGGCPR